MSRDVRKIGCTSMVDAIVDILKIGTANEDYLQVQDVCNMSILEACAICISHDPRVVGSLISPVLRRCQFLESF